MVHLVVLLVVVGVMVSVGLYGVEGLCGRARHCDDSLSIVVGFLKEKRERIGVVASLGSTFWELLAWSCDSPSLEKKRRYVLYVVRFLRLH